MEHFACQVFLSLKGLLEACASRLILIRFWITSHQAFAFFRCLVKLYKNCLNRFLSLGISMLSNVLDCQYLQLFQKNVKSIAPNLPLHFSAAQRKYFPTWTKAFVCFRMPKALVVIGWLGMSVMKRPVRQLLLLHQFLVELVQ